MITNVRNRGKTYFGARDKSFAWMNVVPVRARGFEKKLNKF